MNDEYKKLSAWVGNQRKMYRASVEGGKRTLSEERRKALDAIGFEWKNSDAESWKRRFEELKEYAKEHGDTNVPSSHSNKQLAFWVVHQRRKYRAMMKGEKRALSQERRNLLESVGFQWSGKSNLEAPKRKSSKKSSGKSKSSKGGDRSKKKTGDSKSKKRKHEEEEEDEETVAEAVARIKKQRAEENAGDKADDGEETSVKEKEASGPVAI